MLTFQEINFLGQAIDTSWGNSSTPLTTSMSVKMQIIGENKLLVKYIAVVNFSSQASLLYMKKSYEKEAQNVIEEVIKNVKEKYKELSGKSLKLKKDEEQSIDDVEVINLGVHNPKKTAYYRSNVTYSIG